MEGRLRTLLGFSRLKDFRPVLPRGAVVMDERIRTNAEMRQVDSYQTTAWLPKKAAEQKRATAGRVPPPGPLVAGTVGGGSGEFGAARPVAFGLASVSAA